MGNPVIRKFYLFCKGLENVDEGISHGKEGESRIRDNIETNVQTSWESHQPQISSASEPSKLPLQVTGWCVGLTGFSVFFRCDTWIQGSTPWSLGAQGLVRRTSWDPFSKTGERVLLEVLFQYTRSLGCRVWHLGSLSSTNALQKECSTGA